MSKIKPERSTGFRHLVSSTRYSINGVRRLYQETAFRHIVIGFIPCFSLLVFLQVSFLEYCLFLILFFLLVAVEALNTAIECIVDHLAPHWEEFARDAKDLGSLATMCLLCANGVFLIAVIARSLSFT